MRTTCLRTGRIASGRVPDCHRYHSSTASASPACSSSAINLSPCLSKLLLQLLLIVPALQALERCISVQGTSLLELVRDTLAICLNFDETLMQDALFVGEYGDPLQHIAQTAGKIHQASLENADWAAAFAIQEDTGYAIGVKLVMDVFADMHERGNLSYFRALLDAKPEVGIVAHGPIRDGGPQEAAAVVPGNSTNGPAAKKARKRRAEKEANGQPAQKGGSIASRVKGRHADAAHGPEANALDMDIDSADGAFYNPAASATRVGSPLDASKMGKAVEGEKAAKMEMAAATPSTTAATANAPPPATFALASTAPLTLRPTTKRQRAPEIEDGRADYVFDKK